MDKLGHQVLSMFIKSMDNSYVCFIILLALLTGLNVIFEKCLKALLLRMSVRRNLIILLMDTVWHMAYVCIMTLMIYVYCFNRKISSSWEARLDKELTACKIHEAVNVPGAKTAFITHTCFACHSIFKVYITKGYKNLEFLKQQVFLAIFVLTNYSKCTMFGISLLMLLNLSHGLELMSKFCLYVARHTRSQHPRNLAKVLFGFSLCPWVYTFLYVYPKFLTHNKSVNSAMMKAEINMLIVLDFLSWIYLFITVATSAFSRLVWRIVARPSDGDWISYVLLGRPEIQPQPQPNVDGNERRRTAQENLDTLYQVTRCSMALKKKASEIRARKARESLTSSSSSTSVSNNSNSDPEVAASPSSASISNSNV